MRTPLWPLLPTLCAFFFAHEKKNRYRHSFATVLTRRLEEIVKNKEFTFFFVKSYFFFFHPSMFLTIPLGAEPRYEAIWFGFIIIFFFSLYFGFPAGELTCLPCIINKSTCSANGPPPTRRVGMAGVKKKNVGPEGRRRRRRGAHRGDLLKEPASRPGIPLGSLHPAETDNEKHNNSNSNNNALAG